MKRKLNPYIKMSLWSLFFMVIGALSSILVRVGREGVKDFVQEAVLTVREHVLWVLGFLLICSLAEWICAYTKIRNYGRRFLKEENEDQSDYLENRLDSWSSWSTVLLMTNMIVAILAVCTIYEGELLEEMTTQNLILLCVLFIGQCLASSFWQITMVRQVQKIYPERKGDPSAIGFDKEWLESCDEAQKEVLYQSSYKTYQVLSVLTPVLTVIAMVCHAAWNTGIFAVVICCVIWFLLVTVYSVSSIKIQRSKLNS